MAARTSQDVPPPSALRRAIFAQRAALAEGPPPLPAVVPVATARAPNPALRQVGVPPYEFPLGDAIGRVSVPAAAGAVGDAAQALFPSINAQREAAARDINAYVGQGNYAAATGRALSGFAGQTGGAVVDTVARPVGLIAKGVGGTALDFVKGLFGVGTAPTAPAARAAAPAAARVAPAVAAAANAVAPAPERALGVEAVNQALGAGRAAAPALTPQEALSAAVTSVLSSPNATLADLQNVGQLVPAAVKPTTSNKDRVVGTASSIADAAYAAELAAAKALPAGEERDKAYRAATDSYFQRNAALVGVNPQTLALSKILEQTDQ